MKKVKLVAISSVLMLLLCACSSNNGSSNSSENGFDYNTPTGSFSDNEPNIDYTPTTLIKDALAKLNTSNINAQDEASIALKRAVIEVMDTNDLQANKLEFSNVRKNDYDIENLESYAQTNFEKKYKFVVERNKDNSTKTGVFDFEDTTFEVVKRTPGAAEKDYIKKNTVVTKASYNMLTNLENRQISEMLVFDDLGKKYDANKTTSLTDDTYKKCMVINNSFIDKANLPIYNTTILKRGFIKLLDGGADVTTGWDEGSKLFIGEILENGDVVLSLSAKKTLPNLETPETIHMEEFKFVFAKEGWVKEMHRVYQDLSVNETKKVPGSETENKVLNCNNEDYVFTL